jgi:hypothetical protein
VGAEGSRILPADGRPQRTVGRWKSDASRVTLAIEGWNAEDLGSRALFERTLASLESQTFPLENCEVIILAGDKATSSDAAWLEERMPPARLIRVPGATYYRMKNAAIHEAGGDVIVFADSDVTYGRDWLEAMLNAFGPDVDVVVGNTHYTPGFLRRTLDLCDWPAIRAHSGFTDWLYGNNVAFPRRLFGELHFREDMGSSGGGSSDVLREELRARGIRIWFCAEARAWHHLPSFLPKRLRLGAYHVYHRRLSGSSRGAWVVRVPIAGPLLAVGGTMLMAWGRAWRVRSSLPAKGLSLPLYIGSITLVKSVESLGAMAYGWFPHWVLRHTSWFDVPEEPAVSPLPSRPGETAGGA